MLKNYRESQRARALANGTFEALKAKRTARAAQANRDIETIRAVGTVGMSAGMLFLRFALIGAGLAFGASFFL